MDAVGVVSRALSEAAPGHRVVAPGEWGLSTECGGWALDVGLALDPSRTLLRAQAEVCGPGQADPHALLHRNRRVPLVKLTETLAGVVWIEGWLPVAALDADALDRLLGLLVQTAEEVRASL